MMKPVALSNPPRDVPILVRVAVLLGGITLQIAAGWLALSSVAVWLLGSSADFTSWYVFRGATEGAIGTVLGVTETRLSEGGGKHRRGTPICAVSYRFEDLAGREHEATAYQLGRGIEPGASVRVEYLPDRPSVSRVQGLRRAPFGESWVLLIFVIGFPAIGLAVGSVALAMNLRASRLLGSGRMALGRLIAKETTNTRVNNRRVYKMTFEFVDGNGRACTMRTRTSEPEKLQDDAQERILYDPERPERAVTLDTLPGGAEVDESGNLCVASPARVLAYLPLPVLLVGVNVVMAWIFLR